MKKFCLILSVLLFFSGQASFIDMLKSKKVVGRTSIAAGLAFTGLAALAHSFIDFKIDDSDVDYERMARNYIIHDNPDADPTEIADGVQRMVPKKDKRNENDDEPSEMPFIWETLKKNAPRNRNVCAILAGTCFVVSVWNCKFR